MKCFISSCFFACFLFACADSNSQNNNLPDGRTEAIEDELTTQEVYINGDVDKWIGTEFKGRFLDYTHIDLKWNIHPADESKIKQFRLYRRGWDEASYTEIATFPANMRSFTDVVIETPVKSVWYYSLYADGKESNHLASANITVWQIKDFYTKETPHVHPDTKVWIVNQPGAQSSLSTESRLCLANPTEWGCLSDQVDGILLYRSSIQAGSLTELKALTDMLKQKNMFVGVETSGFQNIETSPKDQLGELSFESEMRAYRNFLTPVAQGGAGGTLDYIYFDGPIHSAVYPGDKKLGKITVKEASEELADLMLLWREMFPQIKFYLIANFSNWGWKGAPARNSHNIGEMGWGDYKSMLDILIPLTKQRGVPFTGISIDYSYEAFLNEGSSDQIDIIKYVDFKVRLKELADYVKQNGMELTMSLNDTRGGNSNNTVFCINVLNYVEELFRYGIVPDIFLLQSWNRYPDAWLPETKSGTMTNLGLRLIDRLQTGAVVTPF